MSDQSRHDSWAAGENYDAYMGRWSRKIAPRFLDWLAAPPDLDWLEVGCGTGALSGAILAQTRPRSLLAIDPSEGFVARAREALPNGSAEFVVGDARALPAEDASRDVIVSGLVLNFVPDRSAALAEMTRVVRPGGRIAFYVWDYPGGGIEFMRAFWTAAAALDAQARTLTEDTRFPFCTPDALKTLARETGLGAVESTEIAVPTVFRDFDDYWTPFTLGAGPAPGYCAGLDPAARNRLRDRLEADLPRHADGSIRLAARAWAIRGRRA